MALARILLTACFALTVMDSAFSDDKLVISRDKAFARDGHVLADKFQLWPVVQVPGRIFTQDVTASVQSPSMRLHFVVKFSSAAAPWTLKVVDSKAKEWTVKSDSAPGEFWTIDLEGSSANVQIFSESAKNPVKLLIDKIAISTPPIKPQSIVGPDDRRPILTQTAKIQGWGASVARIRFIGDDGVQYFCSGFLLTSQLLITNQHCLSSPTEMRSALIDFNYDSDGAKMTTVTCTDLVAVDEALDYSIVRLSSSPGVTPLKLTDTDISESEALLIIEHPGGETKQVSIIDCKVDHSSVAGTSPAATDFGHDCDTLGGSSGSPVQDFATGNVVGLHHLGIPEGTDILMNRAVKIKLILKSLGQKSPAILGEIGTAQK
jgi:V8-like Glu-specific endopeptidase